MIDPYYELRLGGLLVKDYFYNNILKCFDNAIYTRYGAVAVGSAQSEDGKSFRYVAYDIPNDELNQLSSEQQEKHIQIDKTFDISDVNFNNEMSVLQKINDLVTSFEMEVYKD